MSFEIIGTGSGGLCALGRIHFFGENGPRAEAGLGFGAGGDLMSVSDEIARLDIAAGALCSHLESSKSTGEIDFFLSLLDEGENSLFSMAKEEIFRLGDARDAIKSAAFSLCEKYSFFGDHLLSPRSRGVAEAASLLLSFLPGADTQPLWERAAPPILVAKHPTAGFLERIEPSMLLALCILGDGGDAEAAVLTKKLGVPVIFFKESSFARLEIEGEMGIADGEKGILTVSPDGEAVERYALHLAFLAGAGEAN